MPQLSMSDKIGKLSVVELKLKKKENEQNKTHSILSKPYFHSVYDSISATQESMDLSTKVKSCLDCI